MAIVKSGSRQNRTYGSNNRNHVGASNLPLRKSSGVSRLGSEGMVNDDGSFFFDSSSDSSDSEPVSSSRASVGSTDCQICQVDDKVCELPIELFDIPDLSQILSLDTWNSELSEEDREGLLAFLPAMDEDTYRSTLRELLSGASFNFGSPMSDLMQMLKSGECHPQVASLKETLTCLQRREHYHRIRNHHNQMVNNYIEMQHLWQDYPDCSISERVEMWMAWKHNRIRPPLDSRYEKNNSGPFKSQRLQNLLNRKANFLRAKENAMNSHMLDTPSPPPEVAEPTSIKVKRKNKKDAKLKKTGPKGVLKLLPKASNSNSKIESFRSQSPFEQMQAVTCSPYNEVENSFEDVLIPSPPGMYEPVVTLGIDQSASPINDKTSFKVRSENRVKGLGDKNVKGLYGNDRKDKSIGYSRRSKKVNVVVHTVVNEELDPSPLMDDEDLDFSPIDGEPVHAESPSFDDQLKRTKSENHSPVENDDACLFMGGDINEEIYLAEKEMQDILDDKDEIDTEEKPVKRRRKRPKAPDDYSLPQPCSLNGEDLLGGNAISSRSSKKAALPVPPVVASFPFSVIHLLSAVRLAMINTNNEGDYLLNPEDNYLQANGQSFPSGIVGKEQDEKRPVLPAVPLQEIVKRVQDNPGDPKILEAKEPLQGLVKGVLKVLSSKATQPGMKGWKPLVAYNKAVRGWSWIGPVSDSHTNSFDGNEVQISHEMWSVPQKILYKLQELFGNWLKHEQEILQQLGQLSLLPVPATPVILDEKERFRELRAQKSLITISPTSEEMRTYFRMEESLRYSVPDRAFCYTTLDGRKSAVAPLRRIGGKPNSKARDHFMLKPDRPPHVTILCLVRDAAARLPGSIGTRADVCSLIRDSQYIVEDVSDAQLNQVVSGALDRLHYERDPCVRFDGDRKLWVYLHTDKEDEDFEDDATSSTKRWKRTKKEGNENPEFSLAPDYDYTSTRDDQDSCGLGIDFSPTSCFGGTNDLSSVYSSSGRGDLIFTHSAGSLPSPNVLESAFPGQGREDTVLPFIDLPPSIQPPCVNMQQSHPMGWEVLSNRWDQDPPFQSTDHIVGEDYNSVVSLTPSNRESEVMIDGSS